MENKPLLITGIQPTNKLTLGNYLGSIKNIIKQQDEYNCFVFAADWHSITIPLSHQNITHQQINQNSLEIIKTYIACGIDPNKTTIFIQSQIKEHLELFYFLLTHTHIGSLERMCQFKDLSKKFFTRQANGTQERWMGILVYPVLMAADILIYDSDYVSVGEDQTQHLELTIDLAESINRKYNKQIFKIPKSFKPNKNKAGIKIKDLQNPMAKMSKSSDGFEGVIFLNDSPDEIKRKILKAKTDSLNSRSLDRENQPGIVNLLEIYASITEISLEMAFDRLKNNSYKELKEVVAEVVIRELMPIQEKYKGLNESEILSITKKNSKTCRGKALEKLKFIRDAL